jgi:hypothetical protein
MDYDPLLKLPTGTEDISTLFKTKRPLDPSYPGSTYAHHADATTTGYRQPSNLPNTQYEIQPRSGKTLFADRSGVTKLADWLQDRSTATKLVPEMKDGKFTGHLLVQMTEDHYTPPVKGVPGRISDRPAQNLKAGQTVARVPVSVAPSVGAYPVEIARDANGNPNGESPKGSRGGNVHFGSQIVEVIPQGRMAGGSGGAPLMARPPMGGDRNLLHNLNPLALKMASGGVVKMPEHYSQGGWKLI